MSLDPSIIPAIKAAIKMNELGNANPYKLSYAGTGRSGASFGVFQGDVSANKHAAAALLNILTVYGVEQAAIDTIMNILAKPCNSMSLNSTLADTVDAALASDDGRPLVDGLDDISFAAVEAGLNTCINAALTRNFTISSSSLLAMALWINMSGPPTKMADWCEGQSGTDISTTSPISLADTFTYLQSTKYFTENPTKWPHFEASVQAGRVMGATGADSIADEDASA